MFWKKVTIEKVLAIINIDLVQYREYNYFAILMVGVF